MLLMINGKDYSKNILVGTYEVNEQDVEIDSWQDANGHTHKRTFPKTIGSCSMWFRSKVDYWQFQKDLEAVRDRDKGSYRLTVARNNRESERESDFFVECLPTRNRNAANQDEFRDFEFSIEER